MNPEKIESAMLLAREEAANHSPDPRTKVGSMILDPNGKIVALDVNDFPHGVDQNEMRWERGEKDNWVLHAEERALLYCARVGRPTLKCVMVCTGMICDHCASMIVESGITAVYVPIQKDPFLERHDWRTRLLRAKIILSEGGVALHQVNI